MWPRSDAFDAAIHGTHQVVVKADLWASGLTGLIKENLQVVGGSVTVDRTANVRRTGTLQIADDEGLIANVGAAGLSGLEPYGNEITIQRGVQYADGSQELVPLGVFLITSTQVAESSSGRSVSLTLADRSQLVSDSKLVNTYYVPTGVRFVDAIQTLVDYVLPYAIAVDKDVEATTPITTGTPVVFHEQDDPWAAVGKLAAAVGLESWFGPDGRLKLRDIPASDLGDPEFYYRDDELSILLGVDRKLDRGPNAVLLSSSTSAATTPVRSLKWDNNPSSPTWWYGTYGQIPQFVTDDLITTQAQADQAAQARLNRIVGLAESISLATVPHPAHEAGDIVHGTRLVDGLDTDLIVEQLTIPVDAVSAATVVGRTRIPYPA